MSAKTTDAAEVFLDGVWFVVYPHMTGFKTMEEAIAWIKQGCPDEEEEEGRIDGESALSSDDWDYMTE
jgi:hypothetical protein